MTSFLPIFLTGLLTGGFSCLALQGGLLTASIAGSEEENLKEHARSGLGAGPIFWFLVAKLIAYIILGALLGLLGEAVQFSLRAQIILQVIVILFMLLTALHLLDVHPFFRRFAIQPPKFILRRLRNASQGKRMFTPALLGALTVFVPCGTTQAMMVLSIGTGNPLAGAATMFAYVLGTSPIFFIFGYFATKLGDAFRRVFLKAAGVVLILLSLFVLNGTLALLGSPYTFLTVARSVYCSTGACVRYESIDDLPGSISSGVDKDGGVIADADGIASREILIGSYGYSPRTLSVPKGATVRLRLINKEGFGCAQTFTIPSYNISRSVPVGSEATVEFKAPNKSGSIRFMCSMGMYRGEIKVI